MIYTLTILMVTGGNILVLCAASSHSQYRGATILLISYLAMADLIIGRCKAGKYMKVYDLILEVYDFILRVYDFHFTGLCIVLARSMICTYRVYALYL